MNMHTRDQDQITGQKEVDAALTVLLGWSKTASEAELMVLAEQFAPVQTQLGYPDLSSKYPENFVVDSNYKAGLPDLQNGDSCLIRGAQRQIQHVGISNFRLPIRFHTRDGNDLILETSVTGTVSLEACKKGINMSRIMRSFYGHAERTFSFDVIEAVLDDYKS
ncbi:MAG: GTP cyclohydrolase, FolE2/MptA family, partial [Paracoccaceae bacterium]|nr:GTP cyclohydrolase, FolE2/MptA family [Paracoccaceae bacterium]